MANTSNISQGKYIIWRGPLVSENSMHKAKAWSPAANKWQSLLLDALLGKGIEVYNLSHFAEPLWPKGRISRPSFKENVLEGLDTYQLGYWNIPFIRRSSLARAYCRKLDDIIQQKGKIPAAVITYNDFPWDVAIGHYAQEKHQIPWFCIHADALGDPEGYQMHCRQTEDADAMIYLSWMLYEQENNKNRIHVDGGINWDPETPEDWIEVPEGEKIFLYSGTFTQWTGASFLAKAFQKTTNDNIELWFSGKGEDSELIKASKKDSRIRLMGFLSEEDLMKTARNVYAFINPRPPDNLDNQCNFPSKLLLYLAFGKPIISSWTKGLHPDYKKVLFVPETFNEECFAETIEEVSKFSAEKLTQIRKDIYNFASQEKTWANAAEKVLDLVGSFQKDN